MKDEIESMLESVEHIPAFEIKFNPFSKKYRVWNNRQIGGPGWVHHEWELQSEWRCGPYETRFKWLAKLAMRKCERKATKDRLRSKFVTALP
jgi:hypothetical protein